MHDDNHNELIRAAHERATIARHTANATRDAIEDIALILKLARALHTVHEHDIEHEYTAQLNTDGSYTYYIHCDIPEHRTVVDEIPEDTRCSR